MRLVAGLGNPGIEYQFTPHNLGFLVVDRLAEAAGVRIDRPEGQALVGLAELEGQRVMLAKPFTYVNLSGLAIQDLLQRTGEDAGSLIVILDDLALPRGFVRIRPRGSSGGHNGLKSIIGALGTQDFVRVRLGYARRKPHEDAVRHVLRRFRKSELKAVDEQLDLAADAVRTILREGVAKAMSVFNRRA
jgi:PTH1 family peptidyl-tRNA hydrolase